MLRAEQIIGFIHAFLEYPDSLCEEDWKLWCRLIARARTQANFL